MKDELFKIFDEHRNERGVATRTEVHRKGYWHETFHCWLMSRGEDIPYIYLQKRSDTKQDYPSLLDITAAGHLLADESVFDGVREVREELGIDVSFDDLLPLGVLDYCVVREGFIDKEIAHVFLYQTTHSLDGYILQLEEVSGIVRAEFSAFCELWLEGREEIYVEGFNIDKNGVRVSVHTHVTKDDFVPHDRSYYEQVIELINRANDSIY